MAGATTPDGIAFTDTGDTYTLSAITAAMASSIQTALNQRQVKQYLWANATARSGQTGMSAGYLGFQVDTLTAYLYDGSIWRPYAGQMPFIQVGKTALQNIATASTGVTTVAFDSTTTTRGDTATFYSFSNPSITINVAGFYRVYFGVEFGNAATNDTSRRQARLFANGNYLAGSSIANNTSGPQTAIASNVWAGARVAGDVMSVGAGQSSANNLGINNVGTLMAIEYVGS